MNRLTLVVVVVIVAGCTESAPAPTVDCRPEPLTIADSTATRGPRCVGGHQ
jgi:hypothetical protein